MKDGRNLTLGATLTRLSEAAEGCAEMAGRIDRAFAQLTATDPDLTHPEMQTIDLLRQSLEDLTRMLGQLAGHESAQADVRLEDLLDVAVLERSRAWLDTEQAGSKSWQQENRDVLF